MRAIQAFILLNLCFILGSIGCSSSSAASQIITNAALTTVMYNQDNWIQASFAVNTGAFQLPSFHVPIGEPGSEVAYGSLSFTPSQCDNNDAACMGQGNLLISLNVSKISSLPGQTASLPNNTPLPIEGLQNNSVISLPIGNTGARIYFSVTPNGSFLGTAIPFAALDPAGTQAPGVNVFIPLTINNLSLSAGMFFGRDTNTTGFGVFMDISNAAALSRPSKNLKNKLVTPSVNFKLLQATKQQDERILPILKGLYDRHTTLKLKE